MSEKDKALSSAISQLEKKYGKGAIMALGNAPIERLEAYSTGSLGLDVALGIGGLPRGRIIEIYGPESSGKTTLALHVAAEAQRAGGTVVFIDAEHALDVGYAKKLGVDTTKLLVSQPDCGEQALEICETLIQSASVDLIIVDSVAALTPRAEIEGEMDDQQPGLQARLMSKALRKLTAIAAKSHCAILFINQIRMKIGVMFGSPETTAGGNALKFYASVRLDIRKIGSIKDNTDVMGCRVKVKVVKNKVAPPFREAEFDVISNEKLEKLRRLCQSWEIDARTQPITSHRPLLGRFIVAGKKLVFPIIRAALKDTIRQQKEFNAAAIALFAEVCNEGGAKREEDREQSTMHRSPCGADFSPR